MRMMMRDMAETVAAAARSALDAALPATEVEVLVEDKLDAAFEVRQALARTGLLVVVSVAGFDRAEGSGPLVAGTLSLDLRVFEAPALARLAPGAATAQTVAETLMARLHWHRPDGWRGPLLLRGMARADEADGIVCALAFTAEAAIGEVAE